MDSVAKDDIQGYHITIPPVSRQDNSQATPGCCGTKRARRVSRGTSRAGARGDHRARPGRGTESLGAASQAGAPHGLNTQGGENPYCRLVTNRATHGRPHSQVRVPFSALAPGAPVFRMVCMMSLLSSSPNSGRVEMSSSVSMPGWPAA